MTQEELIQMAKEAGFEPLGGDAWDCFTETIKRFASLVAEAEREACAKACEETEVEQFTYCMVLHDDGAGTLTNAASAIRARSNVQGDRLRATDPQEGDKA